LKNKYRIEQSTDRERFLEVKGAEASEQRKSITDALKAAAPTWASDKINFVVGNRRSVVESDFRIKLEKLDEQEEKKDRLFARIVRHKYVKCTIG